MKTFWTVAVVWTEMELSHIYSELHYNLSVIYAMHKQTSNRLNVRIKLLILVINCDIRVPKPEKDENDDDFSISQYRTLIEIFDII